MERIDDLNLNGKKIIQDTELFLFGMDSVLLANKVKGINKDTVIVDLGTGSAVMPVIIAEKNNVKKIIGVELQQKMYDLAAKNVEYNKLQDKVSVLKENLKNIESIRKYIIECVGKDKVDIVISNPPYKKDGTGSKNEVDEKYIARHEVECELEDIFKTATKLLKFKGKLYLVHKPERMADLISLARKYNLEPKEIQFLQPTITKKPSIVLIEYALGGGNECVVLPNLIEYDQDGNYTKGILDIYGMTNS
ncbi:MAG: tRNA1(Val) (adenine(37)-N6)-methyltransferase [Clostridia bacterium]|nr:tRNA1(Val) (adenine(37)-N6)-methyltransferase [Clostridia bacterium]